MLQLKILFGGIYAALEILRHLKTHAAVTHIQVSESEKYGNDIYSLGIIPQKSDVHKTLYFAPERAFALQPYFYAIEAE